MFSSPTTPVPGTGNDRILVIDWSLLFRRAKVRSRQALSSAKYTASRTEYTPPNWLGRFRLTWFRLGLMGIAVFVFTQKQIDFTVSVGKEGFAVGAAEGRLMSEATPQGGDQNSAGAAVMSMLPTISFGSKAAKQPKAWAVEDLEGAAVEAYIRRFEKVALAEEGRYSIPAPANMALAIIHSNAGLSTAAKQKNNHFFPVTKNTHYENAWSNWRSHSRLIDERYPQLAGESVNYQQWLAALVQTDYSGDAELANKVMDVVERFGLERLYRH